MSGDDVVEVSPAPARRRRGLAIAAVLVVLAAGVGVGAWAVTRGDGTGATSQAAAGSAGNCQVAVTRALNVPADLVPATPSASGTGGRLVPDRTPVAVTLCEYDADAVAVAPAGPAGIASCSPVATTSGKAGGPACDPAPDATPVAELPLGRSVSLAGSDPALGPLLTDLRDAPPAATGGGSCFGNPALGATRAVVALTYDDGYVYVASAGPCGGSTNGAFDSSLQIDETVGSVLDEATTTSTAGVPGLGVEPTTPGAGTGTDPSPGATGEPVDPGHPSSVATAVTDPFAACTASSLGGAGSFVPFAPTGVRLCHLPVDPGAPHVTTADRPGDVAVALATTLDALPTLEPDVVCTAVGGEVWQLLFTGADGTTASVRVDAGGCGTASNGTRVARTDAALYAALTAADG